MHIGLIGLGKMGGNMRTRLRNKGIEEVVLCGLARDFCVKWSAEDAAAAGFRTTMLWELTRPVIPASDATVRADLERAGVLIV